MATGAMKKKRAKSSMAHSAESTAAPPPRRRISTMLLHLVLFSSAIFLSVMPTKGLYESSSLLDLPRTVHEVEVVAEFPHDPEAFTQGLLYAGDDKLFESTGLFGKSSVRKVDLRTGKVEILQKMDDSDFGEGLTLLGQRLYQVTWQTKTGFIYDIYNLSKVKPFTHQMEDGWGLATDGKFLFGSDGTSTLYRIDPQTLKVTEMHTIKYNGHEVQNINELEYIDGEVWANVWETDCIARISPEDGSILGWILLPNLRLELLKSGYKDIDVLNGIAWDGDKRRIFVTGKLWPKLFEIRLKPARKLPADYIKRNCMI